MTGGLLRSSQSKGVLFCNAESAYLSHPDPPQHVLQSLSALHAICESPRQSHGPLARSRLSSLGGSLSILRWIGIRHVIILPLWQNVPHEVQLHACVSLEARCAWQSAL